MVHSDRLYGCSDRGKNRTVSVIWTGKLNMQRKLHALNFLVTYIRLVTSHSAHSVWSAGKFLWLKGKSDQVNEVKDRQKDIKKAKKAMNTYTETELLLYTQIHSEMSNEDKDLHHSPPKSRETMRLEAILMLQRSWGSEPPCRPWIISDKASGTPDSANCSFSVSGGTVQPVKLSYCLF